MKIIIILLLTAIYAFGVGYNIHLMEETTEIFDMENMGVRSNRSSVVILLAMLWPLTLLIGILITDEDEPKEEEA